ncbi:MAG TPA: phosphoribosyl-ATP diphosphatase [Alphaproteobacteria bacterium]|nr:phosphoribosyl-ATP diphosphatase [Rhodospirillaceae bacterium]HRJ12814.1 phosphoribosyl-ATP diphosphatase [Alphaproteobacteria bacterium]
MREIEPYTIEMAYAIVQARKNQPSSNSYASQLLAQGTSVIAKKMGEQAMETMIEAIAKNRGRLAEESADLLYHLLVLWADADLAPQDIYEMLAERMSSQPQIRAA